MNKYTKILRVLLLAGGFYFFLISIAHMFGIKIPILYIYFNVPSTGYQDRIISMLAFGWSVFFFSGASDPNNHTIVRANLIASAGAILGLGIINLGTDFDTYTSGINTTIFWFETLLLIIYWLLLVFFYQRSNHG